ncbi:MAG TPA: hypothetical protein VN723_11670 [Rhizomicrobium sp.]|jgi:hypothetical protein|nr:hypothetical protein [Rhizomicrobium sp.]
MIEGSCHCGAVCWKFDVEPDSATTCNCTICRRYGVLWAYDLQGDRTEFSGPTRSYIRTTGDWGEPGVGFYFCENCGCVTHYRAFKPDAEGRIRTAVNLRMAEPEAIAGLPVRHWEGLHSFTSLGQDGRSVADMWF